MDAFSDHTNWILKDLQRMLGLPITQHFDLTMTDRLFSLQHEHVSLIITASGHEQAHVTFACNTIARHWLAWWIPTTLDCMSKTVSVRPDGINVTFFNVKLLNARGVVADTLFRMFVLIPPPSALDEGIRFKAQVDQWFTNLMDWAERQEITVTIPGALSQDKIVISVNEEGDEGVTAMHFYLHALKNLPDNLRLREPVGDMMLLVPVPEAPDHIFNIVRAALLRP